MQGRRRPRSARFAFARPSRGPRFGPRPAASHHHRRRRAVPRTIPVRKCCRSTRPPRITVAKLKTAVPKIRIAREVHVCDPLGGPAQPALEAGSGFMRGPLRTMDGMPVQGIQSRRRHRSSRARARPNRGGKTSKLPRRGLQARQSDASATARGLPRDMKQACCPSLGNFNLHLQPWPATSCADQQAQSLTGTVAHWRCHCVPRARSAPEGASSSGRTHRSSPAAALAACRAATSSVTHRAGPRTLPATLPPTAPAISGVFSNRGLDYHDARGVMNAFPSARRRNPRDERGEAGPGELSASQPPRPPVISRRSRCSRQAGIRCNCSQHSYPDRRTARPHTHAHRDYVDRGPFKYRGEHSAAALVIRACIAYHALVCWRRWAIAAGMWRQDDGRRLLATASATAPGPPPAEPDPGSLATSIPCTAVADHPTLAKHARRHRARLAGVISSSWKAQDRQRLGKP